MIEMQEEEKPKYRGIDVVFHGVNVSMGPKQILKNIYGDVKTGEILVVMGPSGEFSIS